MSDAVTGALAAELTREAAEALLYREARLLDDRRFRDWLRMFTDDARYWLPIANEGGRGEPSLINDDRAAMEERVFRLLDTMAYAQLPPSRTQHDVTNVEVLPGAGPGEARVLCNLTVHELRTGDRFQVAMGEQRSIAARCQYDLVRDAEWLIRRKTCRLLDREFPIYNLTFIL